MLLPQPFSRVGVNLAARRYAAAYANAPTHMPAQCRYPAPQCTPMARGFFAALRPWKLPETVHAAPPLLPRFAGQQIIFHNFPLSY